MNKFLLSLMAALFLVGCASSGGSSAALPEIAPYDDPTYEALPEMVKAHRNDK